MKYLFALTIFISISISSFAAEGIWYLEADLITNVDTQKVYIYSDYWADNLNQKYFEDDILFTQYFFEKNDRLSEVTYFTELSENELYVAGTPFYISPFELNIKTERSVIKEDIKLVCLKKVWYKANVMNTILNPLTVKDKDWLSTQSKRIFESSKEPGCSISAYDFGHSKNNNVFVNEFYSLIADKLNKLPSEHPTYQFLLQELTSRKVVITLFCGC